MKPQIVRVVLNVNREEDRRILDYFLYAGKPMSKLFKTAMLQYLDRLDMNGDLEVSLENIRKVVREELQRLPQTAGSSSSLQPVTDYDDDSLVSPLDFLDELEAMGSD
ncbi:MAG: hypothetical protein IKH03_01325 [Oscillospiraceae bacterium]|nr:hypothetical protein [Oscillospiraceae bacterium]